MLPTSLRCGIWGFAFSVLLAAPNAGFAEDGVLKLSSTAHGIAFDQNNRPIALDEKNIPRAQAGIIDTLRAQLDKASRAEFDAAYKANAEKSAGTPGNEVWANAVAIQSLIKKLQPEDSVTIQTQNLKLLTRYAGLVGKPLSLQDLAAGKRPAFASLSPSAVLNGINISGIFGPFRPLYSYSAKCQAAGVPVPPPLNVKTPSASWHNAGEQKVSYLEPPAPPGLPPPPAPPPNSDIYNTHRISKFSQMFYYIPPDGSGICVANPIVEHNDTNPNSINAFGAICQSIAKPGKPSHACFWDNASDNLDIATTHNFNDTAEFNAPPNLPNDNQCTDCHSGGHAYIIMPKTGIANPALVPSAIEEAIKAFDTAHPAANFHNQDNWFTPLVQTNWPQNVYMAYPAGAATDPNDGATCGGCHGPNGGFLGKTLPNVAGPVVPRDHLYKFCSFIAPDFLTSVHDPAYYYDGAMRNQAASNPMGVSALYSACQAIFPGGYFPASPSAWLVHRDPP